MKILYTLCVILLTNCWSFAQYPFVHLPYSILDELGKMEVPILPDWEVSSNRLPRIKLKWNNQFWNDKEALRKWRDVWRIKHATFWDEEADAKLVKTTATFRRIWNMYRQPIEDTTLSYNYFDLQENPRNILTGYYKLTIHTKRIFEKSVYKNNKFQYGVEKVLVAQPIECWIYVGKVTNIHAKNYGQAEVIPIANLIYRNLGELVYYPSKFPPVTCVHHFPEEHNCELLKVVKKDSTINPYDKKNQRLIDLSRLSIAERDSLFKSLEISDTDSILSLKMEHYNGNWGDFGGRRDGDASIDIEFCRNTRIYYFPNQDLKMLKNALYKAGFRLFKKRSCWNTANIPCSSYLEATYIGTFNLHKMNQQFKPLFEDGRIYILDMLSGY